MKRWLNIVFNPAYPHMVITYSKFKTVYIYYQHHHHHYKLYFIIIITIVDPAIIIILLMEAET